MLRVIKARHIAIHCINNIPAYIIKLKDNKRKIYSNRNERKKNKIEKGCLWSIVDIKSVLYCASPQLYYTPKYIYIYIILYHGIMSKTKSRGRMNE